MTINKSMIRHEASLIGGGLRNIIKNVNITEIDDVNELGHYQINVRNIDGVGIIIISQVGHIPSFKVSHNGATMIAESRLDVINYFKENLNRQKDPESNVFKTLERFALSDNQKVEISREIDDETGVMTTFVELLEKR